MITVPAPSFDTRPRDFSARFGRARLRTVGKVARARRAQKHRGRRAAVLLAAVAVPALAAPQDWGGFDIGNAGHATVAMSPMPFEQTGASFPGSAFYYLAGDESLPPLVPGLRSDGQDAGPTDLVGAAVARSMRIDNSGVDRGRALDCLTAAVYYEAASESDQGQRAVAQVVLNRVAHPSYPNTVCGVVYQGSERVTGCQFSFTCDGSLARRPSDFFWQRARNVALAALGGYVERSVGLATHYHTIAIHPYWAPSLQPLTTIGAHRFYSFRGPAGSLGAFRFAYLGGEPTAGPHARLANATGVDAALDPLAIQRAYEQGLKTAQAGNPVAVTTNGATPIKPAPAPAYAAEVEQRGGDTLYRGDNLPATNQVRPEYQNSGKWIGQPGT